jgi:hypothetical protein
MKSAFITYSINNIAFTNAESEYIKYKNAKETHFTAE